MKKILLSFLISIVLLSSFGNVNASSKIDRVMNNFYSKLDRSISNIDKKINRLQSIKNKINIIKSKKWNKLSNNSKLLINDLEESLTERISFYKKELENQKEEINLYDLLGNINEDNEIGYIKIVNGNRLKFDLISGENFKYDIYMDYKLIATVDNYDFYIKKDSNNLYIGDIYLGNYTNGKHFFKINAYRNGNFIMSRSEDLLITGGTNNYNNTDSTIDYIKSDNDGEQTYIYFDTISGKDIKYDIYFNNSLYTTFYSDDRGHFPTSRNEAIVIFSKKYKGNHNIKIKAYRDNKLIIIKEKEISFLQ